MKVALYDPARHRDKTGILHEKVLLENCPVLNIESRGYAAGTVEHIDRIARQQWRIYRMNILRLRPANGLSQPLYGILWALCGTTVGFTCRRVSDGQARTLVRQLS